MTSEKLLNSATAVLTACALTVTVLLVRREVFPPAERAGQAPTIQRDWSQYASAGHAMGPAEAAVTIVEFADFQCPFCRMFNQEVDSLRGQGRSIRVVYRHFPLSIHPFAIPAARASECAGNQGRFEAMHAALFTRPESIGVAPWGWFARRAGVPDSLLFNACTSSSRPIEALAIDTVAGHRLGIQGTPTLLIGRLRVNGLPSFDSLSAYVSRASADGNSSRSGRH